MSKKILSTKVLPDGLSIKLRENGFVVDEFNFISIEFLPFSLNQVNDILLFTSKNGVQSFANQTLNVYTSVPCLCVGEKTKALLESLGFKVLAFAHYASDLIKIIESDFKNASFTFIAGDIRRDVIPNYFTQNQINFQEITVYKNSATPHKINSLYDGIVFLSPSAVKSYTSLNIIESQICYSIGETTTAELLKYTSNIIQSEIPTIESLVEVILS